MRSEASGPRFFGNAEVPLVDVGYAVVGSKVDLKVVVAGMELSQKALAADELEREAKKDATEEA